MQIEDLQEDWLSAWVPDLIAHADAEEMVARSSWPAPAQPVQMLDVPRADGSVRAQAVLHPALHVALHRAMAPVREVADHVLHPAVFGYRRGADAQMRYADQWRRFCDFNAAQSAAAAVCVETDIARFSEHLRWPVVIEAAERFGGCELPELQLLAEALETAGLSFPPGGYADLRLLYNCLLAPVDAALVGGFSRWIDDFRLFAASEQEAQERLELLRKLLAEQGLILNDAKTVMLSAAEAQARSANTFAGIYVAEDPVEVRRDKLHQALSEAVADPLAKRRLMRFVLGRLEKERDDIAVDFALDILSQMPYEAPRLISYLGCFTERERVADRANTLLANAAQDDNGWLLCRLGSLVLHTGANHKTLKSLRSQLDCFEGSPAWAVSLRILARFDATQPLPAAAADSRALLIAYAEQQRSLPEAAVLDEPATAAAIGRIGDALPLPTLRSIL